MKRYLILIYFSFVFSSFYGQINTYDQPQFIGGRKAFFNYLGNYLSYPPSQQENKIEENLSATIYISKEGKVKFVNVTGKTKEFKDQVKRVLTLMPIWSAAKLNNIAVDTFITQEVYFSLERTRLKKTDTVIYEYLIYQVPMSNKELTDMQKKWQERAVKEAKAKITFDKAAEEINKANYAQAINLYRQAEREGYPKNILYHYNVGVAYIKAGIKDTACMNFQEAARKGDVEAYNLYLKMCK